MHTATSRRIKRWFLHCGEAHAHFCHDGTLCPGLGRLADILIAAPHQGGAGHLLEHQCPEARTITRLLCNVYFGFMLVAPGTDLNKLPPVNLPNYKVDDDNLRAAIDKAYEDDIRLGRMREVDTPPRFISPVFGRVEPKLDGTVKYRRLVDLSAPGGKMSGLSVNSWATHAKFSMHTIPKATASLIPNGWQYVVDFKDAYQSFAVYPGHCELMGTRRPGTQTYTVSTVLVFGGSASAENFCDASSAIAACGSARGCGRLVVHIDDVKGIEISINRAQEALATIKFLMHDMGCEDSPKKEQLAKRVLYCGVWWDTDVNVDGSGRMQASVSTEKLQRAQVLAATLAQRRVIFKHELDSAIGVLGNIAPLIWSAPAFLRRLLEAQTEAGRRMDAQAVPRDSRTRRDYKIEVTAAMMLDFGWWHRAAHQCNGTAIILQQPRQTDGFLYTDASDVGFGGFLITDLAAGEFDYFSFSWDDRDAAYARLPPASRALLPAAAWPVRPPEGVRLIPEWLVCCRETFALLYADLLWIERFRGTLQSPSTDNSVTVSAVKRMGTPHVPTMKIIRALADANRAGETRCDGIRHVPGEDNYVADAASRLRPPGEIQRLAQLHIAAAQAAGQQLPAWTPLGFPYTGFAIHRCAASP